MKAGDTRYAVSLGVRVGFIFLLSLLTIIFVAYYILSENFHNQLTDYTVKLIQTMVNQGVETVEHQLETEQKYAVFLADSLNLTASGGASVKFHAVSSGRGELRFLYVTKEGTTASDGRRRDVRTRGDIRAAFGGKTSVYGPYFNEENEFVVCYSAPVRLGENVVGVLSIEKDGYLFCKLIKNIRFVDSGESYIINADGTDIAVSDPNHIDWVNSQYNAVKLLTEREDPVTRSVMELESKGLAGESGVGTYYWKGSICYVVYAPIPAMHWVLLAGLREVEIASMTQSALYSAISNGPALSICFVIFILLSGLIVYWIISSMKKNAEINEKLEIIANHDSLTGLLNRRFLETNLLDSWKYPIRVSGQAAVFMMDIDDFKRYNDTFGHQYGDRCLCRVAGLFKNAFNGYDAAVMRYGGEEFLIVVFSVDREAALELGDNICRLVENDMIHNGSNGVVTVSVGICYVVTTLDMPLYSCIRIADEALYMAKKGGKNRTELLSPNSEITAPL
ncbi:MAG: diguanylate cyclase [Synergistaceae bacterium]|nr:diguanylate cyclase [Synergistaceae bacterium]